MKKLAIWMLIVAGLILLAGLAVDNWRIRNGQSDLLTGEEWQVKPKDPNEIEVKVTAVSDVNCEECQTQQVLDWMQSTLWPGMEIETVEWDSERGKELIEKFEMKTLPTFVVKGEVEKHPQWGELQEVMEQKGDEWLILGDMMGLPKGEVLELPEVNKGDFVMGDPEAPVTIVEFTDFECPYCSMFATETFPKIEEDFIKTGKVKWVTKAAPLTSMHPHSAMAHKAAIAVGMQGQELFWKFDHKLFSEQERWAGEGEAEILREMAGEVGADLEQFDEDLKSEEVERKFAEDVTMAEEFGVNGVPAFFVGEWVQGGLRQTDEWAGLGKLIEKKLAETE